MTSCFSAFATGHVHAAFRQKTTDIGPISDKSPLQWPDRCYVKLGLTYILRTNYPMPLMGEVKVECIMVRGPACETRAFEVVNRKIPAFRSLLNPYDTS